MSRDALYHITSDNVVLPMTVVSNCKIMLFRDMHNRYWQMVPVTNPAVMFPFLLKPLTEQKFNELKETQK